MELGIRASSPNGSASFPSLSLSVAAVLPPSSAITVLSFRDFASSASSSSVATGRLDIISLIFPAALENCTKSRKQLMSNEEIMFMDPIILG